MLDSLSLSPEQKSFLETATARYEADVEAAASFLVARGIDRDDATFAHLGHVSDPMPGHERFAGFMSLPYITPAGVVAIKFRNLDNDGRPKYDSPAGGTLRLYGVGTIAHSDSDTVLVCEGELDALVAHRKLGVPAVGTPGTNWADHWPRCLADFERVLIVADNDDKADGSNPGLKHARKVQSTMSRSRIITPPLGLDLGDWILRDGPEAVAAEIGLA